MNRKDILDNCVCLEQKNTLIKKGEVLFITYKIVNKMFVPVFISRNKILTNEYIEEFSAVDYYNKTKMYGAKNKDNFAIKEKLRNFILKFVIKKLIEKANCLNIGLIISKEKDYYKIIYK